MPNTNRLKIFLIKIKLHYSFYKFWGLAKNTGYFEKEGVLGVILSNLMLYIQQQ